jgi:hypothetical protein
MKLGLSPLQVGTNFEKTIQECERAEAAAFASGPGSSCCLSTIRWRSPRRRPWWT